MFSMTTQETKATFTLAGLFAFRMLALFMILPVLQLSIQAYEGPALTGWIIGIYGLTQAIFQIPLGRLSDRIGRRQVILFGLFLFIIGSVVAALSESVYGLLLGRALQGAGAIGSTLLALAADLTRDEVRTRAMAVIGITIGFSFLISMIVGPIIGAYYGLQGIFWFTALLGVFGVFWFLSVPKVDQKRYFNEQIPFMSLLKNTQLLRLNFGILVLHALFAGTFLFLPELILKVTDYPQTEMWRVYVPVLVGALFLMTPLVRLADRGDWSKPVLWLGLSLLGGSLCVLGLCCKTYLILMIALTTFFAGFNLLEAQLPSWVSKVAPKNAKGSALGLYSCAQFIGIFLGGVIGGSLQNTYGTQGIVVWSVLLILLWLMSTLDLRVPKQSDATA